ncbi:MAG: AMP-binding protein, partial [Promethearchaeota archaeon]
NVPSLYQILINFKKFKRLDHSKLRMCISAAAPFPKESQEKLEEIVGKGRLLELYGMTELSPVATMNPSIGKKILGKVGLPIQNVKLKIVDADTGEEVSLGEPGEICVAGPLVMQGYYNKPDETAKAIDKDGYMHEDTLSKHPAVGMIALVGEPNPDRPGSEIVNAYIQLDADFEYDGNEEALKEDFINFAKENCAVYEVPKKIHVMEDIPLTVIGKVDKKILRK